MNLFLGKKTFGWKNSNDRGIWKDELTGYRQPLTWESRGIQKIVLPDLKANRRKIIIGMFLCALADICMIAALVTGTSAGSFGEKMVILFLAVLFTTGVIVTAKRWSVNTSWIQEMEENRFEVMECRGYEAALEADIVGGGEIKIYNAQNQYCREDFVIDRASLNEYKEGRDNDFLLMKCISKKGKQEAFYQLFARKKLGGL